MPDLKECTQSGLLGQFVAMGQLVFSTRPGKSATSIYTKEMLHSFLSDVEKNLPLYLETLDEFKKTPKNAKEEGLLTELDSLYLLISCQSFKNVLVDEEAFLKGYHQQMEAFSSL